MERDIGINGRTVAEFELTAACAKIATAATPTDFPQEARARWGVAVLELAHLIGVTLNGDRTVCANCENVGTIKAMIRNDAGDVCGVIYSCERTTCKNAVRSIFPSDVQTITLRPDQRREG